MKMERITQRKSSDCGVACVAMIIQRYAGCPAASAYDAAKAVMFAAGPAGYTGTNELCLGLDAFGVANGGQRYSFKKINSKDMGLDFDAIIATKLNNTGNWHWLVLGASERRLLDPNPKKTSDGHRSARQYIKIMEPTKASG